VSELDVLLADAAAEDWRGRATDRLAVEIEDKVISTLSTRLRIALGPDEACQHGRVIAWERCRALAENPPADGVRWGFLANHVRWRLADAVRAETLRSARHPVSALPPERPAAPTLPWLGPRLERLADELCLSGLDAGTAYRWLQTASDGPRFKRAHIAARLVEAGADDQQADALAWLVRGGARFESVLARLARGEQPEVVFSDPSVRGRIVRAVTTRHSVPARRRVDRGDDIGLSPSAAPTFTAA
jgi:hypothetical protein